MDIIMEKEMVLFEPDNRRLELCSSDSISLERK